MRPTSALLQLKPRLRRMTIQFLRNIHIGCVTPRVMVLLFQRIGDAFLHALTVSVVFVEFFSSRFFSVIFCHYLINPCPLVGLLPNYHPIKSINSSFQLTLWFPLSKISQKSMDRFGCNLAALFWKRKTNNRNQHDIDLVYNFKPVSVKTCRTKVQYILGMERAGCYHATGPRKCIHIVRCFLSK